MSSPGQIVEQLLDAPDQRAATLALLAPDAEVRPLGEDRMLRGIEEIERYASARGDGDAPEVQGATLYEHGENAIVLTQMGVRMESGEKRYRKVVNVGWVVTVRDGKIVRICSYPDWDEARAAGGLPPDQPHTPRRRWHALLMRFVPSRGLHSRRA